MQIKAWSLPLFHNVSGATINADRKAIQTMKHELQIVFRDMPRSEAAEADIRKHVEKLELLCDRILDCRVTLETSAGHKHQGKLYSAHIDLKIPGAEIASTRQENEDVYVAIRDAFDAAKRRLHDHLSKQQR